MCWGGQGSRRQHWRTAEQEDWGKQQTGSWSSWHEQIPACCLSFCPPPCVSLFPSVSSLSLTVFLASFCLVSGYLPLSAHVNISPHPLYLQLSLCLSLLFYLPLTLLSSASQHISYLLTVSFYWPLPCPLKCKYHGAEIFHLLAHRHIPST